MFADRCSELRIMHGQGQVSVQALRFSVRGSMLRVWVSWRFGFRFKPFPSVVSEVIEALLAGSFWSQRRSTADCRRWAKKTLVN